MTTANILLTTASAAGLICCAYQICKWKKSYHSSTLHFFKPSKVLKGGDTEFAILGTFVNTGDIAIVLIKKVPFLVADTQSILRSLVLQEIFKNDIYASYLAQITKDYKPFKVIRCRSTRSVSSNYMIHLY